jgi:hypothetical protein
MDFLESRQHRLGIDVVRTDPTSSAMACAAKRGSHGEAQCIAVPNWVLRSVVSVFADTASRCAAGDFHGVTNSFRERKPYAY